MDIFQRLKDERGITIVLITHEQQVAEYGSRIIAFKDGQIVSDSANDRQRLAMGELALLPPGNETSMSIGSSLTIALRALSRNKLQTALTTIGMTIGVATVLTMIALGTGAEAAIEQQVRAAGMNLIVVTAGNYKTKTEDDGGGVVDHQARAQIRRQPRPAIA